MSHTSGIHKATRYMCQAAADLARPTSSLSYTRVALTIAIASVTPSRNREYCTHGRGPVRSDYYYVHERRELYQMRAIRFSSEHLMQLGHSELYRTRTVPINNLIAENL